MSDWDETQGRARPAADDLRSRALAVVRSFAGPLGSGPARYDADAYAEADRQGWMVPRANDDPDPRSRIPTGSGLAALAADAAPLEVVTVPVFKVGQVVDPRLLPVGSVVRDDDANITRTVTPAGLRMTEVDGEPAIFEIEDDFDTASHFGPFVLVSLPDDAVPTPGPDAVTVEPAGCLACLDCETALAQVRADRDAAIADRAHLRAEAEAARLALESERREHGTEMCRLIADADDMRQDIRALTDYRDALTAQRDELQTEANELRAAVGTQRKYERAAEDRAFAAEDRCFALENEVRKLGAENDRLGRGLRGLGRRILASVFP